MPCLPFLTDTCKTSCSTPPPLLTVVHSTARQWGRNKTQERGRMKWLHRKLCRKQWWEILAVVWILVSLSFMVRRKTALETINEFQDGEQWSVCLSPLLYCLSLPVCPGLSAHVGVMHLTVCDTLTSTSAEVCRAVHTLADLSHCSTSRADTGLLI